MGKGGEKATKKLKLSQLSDAELRKWSSQYGYKEANREEMLEQLNGHADGILDASRANIKNLPLGKPPFDLRDIMNAIPKHCFKRSLAKSLVYLLIDLIQIALLGWAAHTYIGKNDILPEWSPYILWPVYVFCQGTVMTGVWVLAHECGHQSFSESEFWNNTFGTVLHSLLLVPYHSWRITHSRHHQNTGSCENDEVFAPSTRSDWAGQLLRETPLASAIGIFIMLTVGWMPGYLIFNITGPSKYRGKNVNHFSPTAAFFKPEEYWLIVQSDIGFFTVFAAVCYAVYVFGFSTVWAFYLAPLMVTNYHLVLITYLQHTATYLPHFRGKEWSFLRGALCTVDRSFGFIMNHYLHHITDTHVCHHLFSKMPFYHAQEATEAIKKVCVDYYISDDTPIAKAVMNSFHQCQYVEDSGDVVFYKNMF